MVVKPQFKVGDLVELRSGGPTMTVTDVREEDPERNWPVRYDCTWFAGKKNETGHFPELALKPAQAEK